MNSMATHSGTSDKRLANIFLASQSPRRRELLQQIGVYFEVLSMDIDESHQTGETPQACVQRLALAKARAGRAFTAGDGCRYAGGMWWRGARQTG